MEQQKIKIFVSAFSCMPDSGSEPGVGWHWILEMSKYFELWVLVHKERTKDIEYWIKKYSLEKQVHFIFYDIPFNSLFFKRTKFRWVRTYYVIWTWLADRIVKKTMMENKIDIFHHLTFGNAIWPVSRYGRKKFFIWGPVGGVEYIPSEFASYYEWKSWFIEWIRRIIAKNLKYNWGFINRCKNANLIFCKTECMRLSVPVQYRDKALVFTDVAVEKLPIKQIEYSSSQCVKYISVGRLDAWRGFDLLIEAFADVVKENTAVKLTIIGSGLNKKRLECLIAQKGLESYVEMPGNVSIEAYYHYLKICDVLVNPCLKEGAVTVSFDTMSYGKPLICVDTGGYTRYFSEDYSIVIPMQKRECLIQSLKVAMLKLSNLEVCRMMGQKAQNAGESFTWEQKGKEITDVILKNLNSKS